MEEQVAYKHQPTKPEVEVIKTMVENLEGKFEMCMRKTEMLDSKFNSGRSPAVSPGASVRSTPRYLFQHKSTMNTSDSRSV